MNPQRSQPSPDARARAALRRFDPAPRQTGGGAPALTPAQAERAAATLERILAGAPDVPPPPAVLRRTPGRRPPVRRRTLVALAAAVAVIGVVVPVVTTGGDQAYASWSPTPVPLSAAEGAAAARACLTALDTVPGPPVPALLAERRGGWTYVLLRPASDRQVSCLMPTEEITRGTAADRRRWFSSDDAEVLGPVRDPAAVRVDGAATGTTEEGLFSYSEGAVGRDVVALTFTTPRGVSVRASVGGGRYAVWWPAGRNRPRSPEISGAADVDVTLTDGTTYRLPR